MTTRMLNQANCEQLLGEHTALCELVTTLYRVLAERHEPVTRVAHLLETLEERLEAHFQDEERSTLFEDLVRRAPHLAEETLRLKAEHGTLRNRLRFIRAVVDGQPLKPETWQAVEKDFREFHDQLFHHEAHENELLQRVFGEDIGSKD